MTIIKQKSLQKNEYISKNTPFKIEKEVVGVKSTVSKKINPEEISFFTTIEASLTFFLFHKDKEVKKLQTIYLDEKNLVSDKKNIEKIEYEIQTIRRSYDISYNSDFHIRCNLNIEFLKYILKEKEDYFIIDDKTKINDYFNKEILFKYNYYKERDQLNYDLINNQDYKKRKVQLNFEEKHYELTSKYLIKAPKTLYFDIFNSRDSSELKIHEAFNSLKTELKSKGFKYY